jgi:hypothetical protein
MHPEAAVDAEKVRQIQEVEDEKKRAAEAAIEAAIAEAEAKKLAEAEEKRRLIEEKKRLKRKAQRLARRDKRCKRDPDYARLRAERQAARRQAREKTTEARRQARQEEKEARREQKRKDKRAEKEARKKARLASVPPAPDTIYSRTGVQVGKRRTANYVLCELQLSTNCIGQCVTVCSARAWQGCQTADYQGKEV